MSSCEESGKVGGSFPTLINLVDRQEKKRKKEKQKRRKKRKKMDRAMHEIEKGEKKLQVSSRSKR